tara:strand:+ start:729 stop:947 length:219 start_codon:yes stop_codon:yes gene_type:complete
LAHRAQNNFIAVNSNLIRLAQIVERFGLDISAEIFFLAFFLFPLADLFNKNRNLAQIKVLVFGDNENLQKEL